MKLRKKELLIIFGCIFIWFLVQFLYSNFVGSLADQDKYLTDEAGGSYIFSNTNLVKRFYQIIQIFLPGKLAALAPLSFTAIFLYKSIRTFYFHLERNQQIITLLCFCLPHFWIWQSVASKEGIIIPFGLIFTYYFSKNLFFKTTFKEKVLEFSSLIVIALLKISLMPAYIILVLSIFFDNLISFLKEIRLYIVGTFNYYFFMWMVLISTFSVLVLRFFKLDLILGIEKIMLITSLHLLQTKDASTSRYDFDWSNYFDFFNNMSWGIPASFLGFLPSELEYNPIYILLFLEGIFLVVLILINQLMLINLSKKLLNIRFIYFFGILPAIIYLVFLHYSTGIFNAGTSIRYKQNILPIMLFLPIYIQGFFKLRLSRNTTKN